MHPKIIFDYYYVLNDKLLCNIYYSQLGLLIFSCSSQARNREISPREGEEDEKSAATLRRVEEQSAPIVPSSALRINVRPRLNGINETRCLGGGRVGNAASGF